MLWALPDDQLIFPHPLTADEYGPLGIGGSLSPVNIILSYRYGIFPWYAPEDPVLWWYTNPRSILKPSKVHISKSMRKLMRDTNWHVTFNKAFDSVIEACRQVNRKGQDSTWIHQDLIRAFLELHDMGYAHSVEVWDEDRLIGGLYGVSVGKIFCGESMFTHESNASKLALIHLGRHLTEREFDLIDCQQETQHLNSMGAKNMSGKAFFSVLRKNILFTLAHGDRHFYPDNGSH